MKIAVIGGGINGLFSSWALSKKGHKVSLYEAEQVLSKTSSSSSKLLHGGIRYLEQGHFSLVAEALKDRHWWITNAPQHVKSIKLIAPIYKDSTRKMPIMLLGALFYRILSGSYSLGPSRYINLKNLKEVCPDLHNSKLKSAVAFYDAQMDEEALGDWVRKKSISSGVDIFENIKIDNFNCLGEINFQNEKEKFDLIINAAGPWANELNIKNNIKTNYSLDLIKGSHILIKRNVSNFFLFQDQASRRIVFVLPYKGSTLIGTTEVPQKNISDVQCSDEEASYLVNIFNSYFQKKINKSDIISTFSGIRPIVKKKNKSRINFSSASRESVIETYERVLTVYGGKWTSAPSLSKKVISIVEKKYD